jgi:HD-GYP domain-containing protein (c-di-GMP phosphodiesterase class II)
MDWLTSVVERLRRGDLSPATRSVSRNKVSPMVEQTTLAMRRALHLGCQAQTWRFGFVEHCARVALIARWMAEELELPEASIETLEHASQLHEIGMIAVPPTLVQSSRPLTPEELARVRAQASIGAEIVRAAHAPPKADLIEQQYATLAELRQRFAKDPHTLQLAAILRVADVYDTLTHPRPYQREIPKYRWREVLADGLGTQFEPDAAGLLLRASG